MSSGKAPAGRNLSHILAKNMKWLHDRLGNDLEKQMLVISYIEEFEDSRQGRRGTPRKKGAEQEEGAPAVSDADEPGLEIPEDALISRQSMKYSGWPKKLLIELFCYCEPRVWTLARKKVDSVIMARQRMEFAFEIKCMEDKTSDRPGSKSKKQAFESLRQLYMANGRRFIDLNLRDGFVDWRTEGFFAVADEGVDRHRKVTITDKINKQTAVVAPELISGYSMTFSNENLHHNFSWSKACLHLGKSDDNLLCSQFFPTIRRSLTRKLSDQLGATGRNTVEHGAAEGDSFLKFSPKKRGSSQSDSSGTKRKIKGCGSDQPVKTDQKEPKSKQKPADSKKAKICKMAAEDETGEVPSPADGQAVASAASASGAPKESQEQGAFGDGAAVDRDGSLDKETLRGSKHDHEDPEDNQEGALQEEEHEGEDAEGGNET